MIKIIQKKASERSFQRSVEWLKEHQLSFEIINKQNLTVDIIKKILSLSDRGFDEILLSSSSNRVPFKDLEESSVDDLVSIIVCYPKLLKSTIVFDEINLQIGFDSDEFRKFIPRDRRLIFRKKSIK